MTYNLWNFDGEDNSREDDIQMVISEINPDIIVAEELDGDDGFDALGTDILDQIEDGLYTGAPFTNQSNTNVDIGLYYQSSLNNTKIMNHLQLQVMVNREEILLMLMI